MRGVVVAAVAAVVLSGCGNAVTAEVNGATGISVNAQGNPVVLVAVCRSTIDKVIISGDREGLKDDEPNPILGTWTARKPLDGVITLDLDNPGADWTSAPTFTPEDGRGYIVIASQAKADVEAAQVAFRGRDLAKLTPETVRVDVSSGTSEDWPRSEFMNRACPKDSGGGY